jgi:KinB signaling pathway activation protein
MTRLDLALAAWLVACAAAGLAQVLASRRLGQRSAWGISPGWQREIGLWNLALCVGISCALLSGDVVAKVVMARTVGVLAVLLGLHHVAAARTNPAATHVVGAAANAVGLAVVAWALCTR